MRNEFFQCWHESEQIAGNHMKKCSWTIFFLPFLNKDGCQWSIEANALVQSVMDQFPSIQAQIVGYTDQGIPEILLFVTIAPQVSTPLTVFFYQANKN